MSDNARDIRRFKRAMAAQSKGHFPRRSDGTLIGDPFAGVVSIRGVIHSGHGPQRPWSWSPNRDPPMHVHGDGYTTAHAGGVSDASVDEVESRFVAAGLTAEEREVLRRQLQGEERAAIAHAMVLTWRTVKLRLERAREKLRVLDEVGAGSEALTRALESA